MVYPRTTAHTLFLLYSLP